jgi:hypothetical protein
MGCKRIFVYGLVILIALSLIGYVGYLKLGVDLNKILYSNLSKMLENKDINFLELIGVYLGNFFLIKQLSEVFMLLGSYMVIWYVVYESIKKLDIDFNEYLNFYIVSTIIIFTISIYLGLGVYLYTYFGENPSYNLTYNSLGDWLVKLIIVFFMHIFAYLKFLLFGIPMILFFLAAAGVSKILIGGILGIVSAYYCYSSNN